MVHHLTWNTVWAVATCRTHFVGGSVRPEAGLVSVSDELWRSFLGARHYKTIPEVTSTGNGKLLRTPRLRGSSFRQQNLFRLCVPCDKRSLLLARSEAIMCLLRDLGPSRVPISCHSNVSKPHICESDVLVDLFGHWMMSRENDPVTASL